MKKTFQKNQNARQERQEPHPDGRPFVDRQVAKPNRSGPSVKGAEAPDLATHQEDAAFLVWALAAANGERYYGDELHRLHGELLARRQAGRHSALAKLPELMLETCN